MTANEKIAKLIEVLKSGKTLYISTALKCIKVTPATLAKWETSGRPLFKASNGSMWIASGKSYVCIDLCKFTVES